MGAGEKPLAESHESTGPVTFTAGTLRRFLFWGSASTVACLALCALAANYPQLLDRWDQRLQLGPDSWRAGAPWLERQLVWVSYAFGTVASAIATAVVAGTLLAYKQIRAATYVVLVMAGTSLVTSLLKHYLDFARPVVSHPIIEYASSAMPSGHASNIAAAVTATCVLSALFLRRHALRRLVLTFGLLLALIVGLDRLMLGVHTLTEVVAGYSLGIGIGLIAAYFVKPAAARRRERMA